MSWCKSPKVNDKGDFCYSFCGGSIYNQSTIITAAHCCDRVKDLEVGWEDLTIVAGELDLLETSGFEQIRHIKSHVIHPGYDPTTLQNDICLLTLDTPLEFNENAKSIPLDTVGPISGQNCTVSGWGLTKVKS